MATFRKPSWKSSWMQAVKAAVAAECQNACCPTRPCEEHPYQGAVQECSITYVAKIVLNRPVAWSAQYCQESTCTACKRCCSVSAVRWLPHSLPRPPSHPQGPLHCQSPRPHPRSVPCRQSPYRPPLQAVCRTQRRRSPCLGPTALVGHGRSLQPHSFGIASVPVRRRLGSFPAWEVLSRWDRAVPALHMPKQHKLATAAIVFGPWVTMHIIRSSRSLTRVTKEFRGHSKTLPSIKYGRPSSDTRVPCPKLGPCAT